MIAALIVLAVLWWVYWRMWGNARSPRTTIVAASAGYTSRNATPLRLEDDPDHWSATRGAWTALDERQLTRFLVDSAAASGTATSSADTAVPHDENGDMP